jgi:DNA-binding transcriptional ArsR family regulator
MVLKTSSSPFGGLTRTRVLIALRLLGSSYPQELARILGGPASGIRKALRSLERDALVAGRDLGRSRVYQLNPTYFARDALQDYLFRLAEADPDTQRKVSLLRRRPRRTGKPL